MLPTTCPQPAHSPPFKLPSVHTQLLHIPAATAQGTTRSTRTFAVQPKPRNTRSRTRRCAPELPDWRPFSDGKAYIDGAEFISTRETSVQLAVATASILTASAYKDSVYEEDSKEEKRAAKEEEEKAAAAAAAVKSGQEGGSEPHQASTCSSGGKRTLHSELARLLETSPGMQSTKFERQFKPGDRVTAKFGAVKGGTRWFAGRVASVRCAAAIYLQSTSLLHPPTAHLLPPTKYELFSSVVLPWPQ
jgi:hypothetical protein